MDDDYGEAKILLPLSDIAADILQMSGNDGANRRQQQPKKTSLPSEGSK